METMLTILWQIVTISLLTAVGYLMHASGKISQEGSKAQGTIFRCPASLSKAFW